VRSQSDLSRSNAKANSAKRISKMPPNHNKMSDVVQPFTVVQRLHLPFVHSNLDYNNVPLCMLYTEPVM